MRYTLIGASLRGELLEPHPSVLRQRLAAALSGTSAPSVPKVRDRWTQRLARPLLGVGIAASVAVAAIGMLRSMNEASFAPGATTPVAGVPAQARDALAAPLYVVPQEVEAGRLVTPPIRLTNYLMHHGEYASGLTRTSVNSNVVGAAMEPAVSDVAVSKPVAVGQEGLE
jgi:hypothetical protein